MAKRETPTNNNWLLEDKAVASPDTEIGAVGWRPSEVHPAASVFPMMADDELAGLADDVKENGLIHPIVIDANGVLIDGRNRLRACEMAEVEPTYRQLNGQDAAGFIVSANLARRNMKKGQQSMALAMIYPESSSRGGRGKKDATFENHEDSSGFRLLQQARQILRHSRALAEEVLSDRTPFDVALSSIQADREKSRSKEAQMTDLRRWAPDVAAMVDDERLTLEAGKMELSQRQQRTRQCIEQAKDAMARFVRLGAYLTVIKLPLNLSDHDLAMIGVDPENFDLSDLISDSDIDDLVAAAKELKAMKELKG